MVPPSAVRRTPVLYGRRIERETLQGAVAGVREGRSAVLVLRGDAGLGKTALLDDMLQAAGDMRILRAVGVDSEMELTFAGLHQLCAPLLDHIGDLPEPQREALGVAFGMHAGEARDRFLVGLAVLNLLAAAAEERPVLCVVDDAQWLDRESVETLAFVARRLLADPVGLVFATREDKDALARLPELRMSSLRSADARALLASVVNGPLDERVRDRILAETHGNPLALLELSQGLAGATLAGGFALPDAPLASRIEASFAQRLDPLPADTRRLVLVAAADSVGDPALLRRACERLGIAPEAAAPAEDAGLLRIEGRVTFSHPLARSAAYRAASPAERRAVHAALAEATDPETDPDRRAWHGAQAAAGPDEAVAVALERSAGGARTRGGLAAAAAFLERAAALSADAGRRTDRALAAAEVKHEAGQTDAAVQLLAIAELGPLDARRRARLERLHAQLAFAQRRGGETAPLLLRAAGRLAPLDPALARETYLEALGAALSTGHGEAMADAAQALRALPPAGERAPLELLLTAQALVLTDGPAVGLPVLRRALDAFRGRPITEAEELRTLLFASLVATSLWDDEALYALSARQVKLARDAGALTLLPLALEMHCTSVISAGQFDVVDALLDQAAALTEAAGSVPLTDAALLLAAWRGVDGTALERIDAASRDARGRDEESTLTVAEYAAALLHNGHGRYEQAAAAARRSCEHHPARAYVKALVELVEAASRAGDPGAASGALERVSEGLVLSGTDWGLGIHARARALLASDDDAEPLYREAVARLGRTRARVELARAHLVYGEWLRRRRRRLDARTELRIAHELFAAMGATGFAERAARELQATGETARKRSGEAAVELTPQEAHVARLARAGLSNPEIGARLFISPRTAEYHLRKVFTKLGIRSRAQLEEALAGDAAEPEPVA